MNTTQLLNKAVWRMKTINRIRKRRVEIHRRREAKKAFLKGIVNR